ncbi:MAG TPA: tRNA pseudouridine(55) synthase TruB [Acidimicrobiales bacterium]|nr:tRNA pseudouridine(55) synthase TruB [Acidimicrobiales bacterium]
MAAASGAAAGRGGGGRGGGGTPLAVVDGLAVVDKPAGFTSHDVIGVCRKRFGQKRIGHAGTLDPDATGVLIVAFGRVTRLLQFVTGMSKSYQAEVVLGVATSTLDAAGEVTGRWDQSGVTLEQARNAAAGFVGTTWQVPPMVSAVKVGGRRLHQLARAGVEVERSAREVHVTRFDVDLSPNTPATAAAEDPCDGPVLLVHIDCSSGTYVRVLAADLGAALGGGAHVRRLRRTAFGPWTEEQAVALDSLDRDSLLPPLAALPGMDRVMISPEAASEVAHGKVMDAAAIGATGAGPWSIIGPNGDLLAVYQRHGAGRVKPAVVLAGSFTARDGG